ncbi:MAG: hypothetical protein KGL10_00325, partial [Alphaproteobacteria bacterium]|nr:hypothetical protein [Alphaproteobacteria bacterium]
VLSTVAKSEQKKKTQAEPETRPPENAARTAPAPAPAPPPAKKRQTLPQETVLPVVAHNPMGMGANVFGGMVFLFCTFLSLAVLFIGKGPVLRRWPQMTLFYRALGFGVQAPGAGLKFGRLTAERRIDDKGRTLVIEGQMSNTTERDIAYPPLSVILKTEDGKVVKTWSLKTGVTRISGGDIVPVMMQLNDAPAKGSAVELRVKGK